MVHIRAVDQPKGLRSPKGEVGEIDTKAPFQSVKAAVNLFGGVAVSMDKDKHTARKPRLSSENVLEKEGQLLLVQRELDKYEAQLHSAETTKARAHSELDKAKITLNDLAAKLKTVNESKESAVQAAEAVKKQAKQLEVAKSQPHVRNAAWKQEIDQEREQYMILVSELDVAKQELTKVRQDFDATLEAKSASFQQAAEAQRLGNMNKERVNELLNEIRAMKESAQELKLASIQAQEQYIKIVIEKEDFIEACKTTKQVVDNTLESLRQEYDPDVTTNLEVKLAEKSKENEALQEEMERADAFEIGRVKLVTTELNEARKTLQEVAEEKSSFRNVAASLRQELEDVKKERVELENKIAGKEYAEKVSLLEKLTLDAESGRREAEVMMSNANKLRQEAEIGRLRYEEAKEKLERALREVQEATAAEKKVHDEMKILSEKQNNNSTADQESDNMIKISLQEFESLKNKVVECDNTAEAKEAEAIAEVEVLNAKKFVAEKKLEEYLKTIVEIKEATDIAVKSAEMAEAAQSVVEGELRRWRQKDDK